MQWITKASNCNSNYIVWVFTISILNLENEPEITFIHAVLLKKSILTSDKNLK